MISRIHHGALWYLGCVWKGLTTSEYRDVPQIDPGAFGDHGRQSYSNSRFCNHFQHRSTNQDWGILPWRDLTRSRLMIAENHSLHRSVLHGATPDCSQRPGLDGQNAAQYVSAILGLRDFRTRCYPLVQDG